MIDILGKAVGLIGSFGSLIVFIINIKPKDLHLTTFRWGLIIACIVFFFLFLALEIIDYYRNRSHIFKIEDKDKIENYMYKWILKGDRVAIFTRDMSWAKGNKMMKLLSSKAKRDELMIFLPKLISIAEKLQNEGAEIYEYPELIHTPMSRFTMINYMRDNAEVAITGGSPKHKGKHVIFEYSSGENPVFSLAKDMIEIVKKSSDCKRKSTEGERQ
ncbi:MAG: hypothetical protein K8T10_05545 [Candidatus Eremiobacteraeota bacterium]|nr:hypothetical protein [Candidatus Eremiobacteraeota bacterium]